MDMIAVRQPEDGGAVAGRLATLDWDRIARGLDADGHATTGSLLTPAECRVLRETYRDAAAFRSRIVMARHGFGQGEYQYFSRPLPVLVDELRQAAWPHLVPSANWAAERLGRDERWPNDLDAFLANCHAAGQSRPTPLLLKYGPGDYNCLHQDLYGDLAFPFQLAVLLSEPGEDFEGGEFVLVEQRPRMQSRPMVVPLRQGEGVIFATSERPVQGSRGWYRVNLRHGVSRVRAGERFTLGVIFHDAR
jgi:hypothetical protein